MKKLLAFVLLVSAIYAQTNKIPSEIQKSIDKAKDYYNVSLYDESKTILVELLYSGDLGNVEAEVRFHLGVASYYQGKIGDAVLQWTRIVREFPENERTEGLLRFLANFMEEEEGYLTKQLADFEFNSDLNFARLLWTPVEPDLKFLWGDIREPKDAIRFYESLLVEYDDPNKRFIIYFNLFMLYSGLNENNFGYKNEKNSSGKNDEMHAKKVVSYLTEMEKLVKDDTDLNHSYLVKAYYVWALRLSGYNLISGKVTVKKDSKVYFKKVRELTKSDPKNLYNVFSLHWIRQR